MTKYIDKSAVMAEIDTLQDATMENGHFLSSYHEGIFDGLSKVETFLDTLNGKEVDLEEEIDKIWNPRFNLGWDEKSLLSMNHEGFTTIARHFYELGLKAQKGE